MSDRDYPFFKRQELACKYSNECEMDEGFMEKLVELRKKFNKPMRISSAYRSKELHPIEKAKLHPGYHARGMAADVLLWGPDAWELVNLATSMGMSVGIMQKGAIESRFIHVDSRTNPQTIWSY